MLHNNIYLFFFLKNCTPQMEITCEFLTTKTLKEFRIRSEEWYNGKKWMEFLGSNKIEKDILKNNEKKAKIVALME